MLISSILKYGRGGEVLLMINVFKVQDGLGNYTSID